MIIDANIAVYWIVPSEFESAVGSFRGRPDLIAPNLILVETSNALYFNARAGKIAPEACSRSVAILEKVFRELVPDRDLLPSAIEIALRKSHPVYDCLYLALALERREPLATADRKLASIAGELSIEIDFIQPPP